MHACRRDPDLARAINAILLRASRRLRARIETDRRLRVAGKVEGIILDLALSPPDVCRVDVVEREPTETAPDLTV